MSIHIDELSVTSMRLRDASLHNFSGRAARHSGLDPSLAITAARLPLGALGVALMLRGEAVAALACFVVFAAVDVADGHIARLRGEETGLRRLTDVLVDRITIHAFVLGLSTELQYGWLLFATFLGRDMAQGALSGSFTWRHSSVLVGPRWHMSYGLSMLAWIAYALLTNDTSPTLTALTWLVSLATLADFTRRLRRIVRLSGATPR